MTPANSPDYRDHDDARSESTAPRMQRMQRKTQPLRGKYVKKRRAVRRGIKQRRVRHMTW